MPFYVYTCAECGGFEASRPLSDAALPHPCPDCERPAPRALARPHVRTSWAGIRYVAEARNEKSGFEPAVEHRLKSASPHKHGHAEHRHGTHGHSHPKRNQRPWMIGH